MKPIQPFLGLILLGGCPPDVQNIGDPTGDPGTTGPTPGPTSMSTSDQTSTPTSGAANTDDPPATTDGVNDTDDTDVATSDTTTGLDPTAGNTEATTTTAGDTVEPACVPAGDGLESSECLAIDPDRPFCEVDTCVACGALGPDACATATAGARPVCSPAGACVECDSSDALAQGQCLADKPHCDLETGTCTGCVEHSECPETACELAMGACFPSDQIIYVRQGPTPGAPCSVKLGSGGTMQLPYCDFDTAILSVQQGGFSTGYTFHLMGNDEAIGDPGSVIITGGDVPVAYAFTHDPGGVSDKHTRFKGVGPLIVVPGNVTLYLKNWGIIVNNPQGESSRGIDCQAGGAVWLDDSRVLYSKGAGIRGEGCDIHLRRSGVAFGSTEAIEMTGGSLHAVNSYLTANSNIVGKGGGGLHLIGDATADIVYSTLADNANEPSQMPGQFGDTIQCDDDATVTVRNSILARKPGNANLGVACPGGQVSIDRSIVDGDYPGDNLKLSAEDILAGLTEEGLTGLYRVNATHADVFATVARWQSGDPFVDIDLSPRNAVIDGEDFAGADVYP